jgi:hypothetical protein
MPFANTTFNGNGPPPGGRVKAFINIAPQDELAKDLKVGRASGPATQAARDGRPTGTIWLSTGKKNASFLKIAGKLSQAAFLMPLF